MTSKQETDASWMVTTHLTRILCTVISWRQFTLSYSTLFCWNVVLTLTMPPVSDILLPRTVMPETCTVRGEGSAALWAVFVVNVVIAVSSAGIIPKAVLWDRSSHLWGCTAAGWLGGGGGKGNAAKKSDSPCIAEHRGTSKKRNRLWGELRLSVPLVIYF